MTGSAFKAATGVLLCGLLWSTGSVQADQPQVIAAEASPNGDGSYTVSATIRHGDTGWDHYADNFEVLGPDGTVLERRVLYHPHVDEQPFTRSVGGVNVPPGIKQVIVRAHDKVHGYGNATVTVTLPDR
ncbi:MAG TPA: hypothetical protein DCG48_00590 [Rhodospirillaceae bacterium]|nr:hypothetical protein [Rhodospirillaceae bacterium]